MAGEFKVGDIVQLKSGGPKMTVDYVMSDKNVRVKWFAGSKMETAQVHNASIEHVTEAPKAGGTSTHA